MNVLSRFPNLLVSFIVFGLILAPLQANATILVTNPATTAKEIQPIKTFNIDLKSSYNRRTSFKSTLERQNIPTKLAKCLDDSLKGYIANGKEGFAITPDYKLPNDITCGEFIVHTVYNIYNPLDRFDDTKTYAIGAAPFVIGLGVVLAMGAYAAMNSETILDGANQAGSDMADADIAAGGGGCSPDACDPLCTAQQVCLCNQCQNN